MRMHGHGAVVAACGQAGTCSLCTCAGTWWETARLASGGEAVAQMIGARRVDSSTRDLAELVAMAMVRS